MNPRSKTLERNKEIQKQQIARKRLGGLKTRNKNHSKGTGEIQNQEQTENKELALQNKEQTARKRLRNLKTRSKPLERN